METAPIPRARRKMGASSRRLAKRKRQKEMAFTGFITNKVAELADIPLSEYLQCNHV
jgi:hypothetical protein